VKKINYTELCPIDTCTLQQLYKVIAEFSSPSSKALGNIESLSCETIHLVPPLLFDLRFGCLRVQIRSVVGF